MNTNLRLPTFNSPDGRMLLKDDYTGDYVRRTDHEAVVKEMQAEIQRLICQAQKVVTGTANVHLNPTDTIFMEATD